MAIAQQLVQHQHHKQWQQHSQIQQQPQPSFCVSKEPTPAAGNPWAFSTNCTAWPSKVEELAGSSSGYYTDVYDFNSSSGSLFNESTSVLDLSASSLLLPPMVSHVQESEFLCKEKSFMNSSEGIDIRYHAITAGNCGLNGERFSTSFAPERMEYDGNLACQIVNSGEVGQALMTVDETGDRAGFFPSGSGLKQTSFQNMSYDSVQTINHTDFGFGDVSSEWMDCLMCDLQPEDAEEAIVSCFDTNPCESTQSSEPALAANGYPCTPDCALPDGFTVLEEAARIECRSGDISPSWTQDTGNEVLSSSPPRDLLSASSSDLISTKSLKRPRIHETVYVGHEPLIVRNLQQSQNPCLQQGCRDSNLSNGARLWTTFRTDRADHGTTLSGKASSFGEADVIRKGEIKTELGREGDQVSSHGVQLMQLLLECAKTVDSEHEKAEKVLPKLQFRSSTTGDPIQRLAAYFTDALSTRLAQARGTVSDRTSPRLHEGDRSPHTLTLAYKALNDACPYFTFAQLTANQAILEAIETAERVHIIDFGISQGTQWAAFLQAIATRGGERRVPKRIRITGIASPELGENRADMLSATRRRLEEFGRSLELKVEFRATEAAMGEEGLEAEVLEAVEEGEVVAVNFMLELCNLLAGGGGGEEAAVMKVLKVVERVSPKVVAVAEMDAGLNAASFQKRFVNALHFYSAMFDSLEASMPRDCPHRRRMEGCLLGDGIRSVVGSEEGRKRRRRLQAQEEWNSAMQAAGFRATPLSNYAISQARILLWRFCESFTLSEAEGALSLSLGWQNKPLLTVSAWTCRPPSLPSAASSPPPLTLPSS